MRDTINGVEIGYAPDHAPNPRTEFNCVAPILGRVGFAPGSGDPFTIRASLSGEARFHFAGVTADLDIGLFDGAGRLGHGATGVIPQEADCKDQ